jgi:hypothetical protein
MGEARKKAEVDPEEARALSAREALPLISSPLSADEEGLGRSEGAPETDGDVESVHGGPASPGA